MRIPPYDDDIFPHRSYPPWQSLMRVLSLIADILSRREQPKTLRHVEIRLFQAGKRIFELARGDLTVAQWQRRIVIAVDRLEHARRAAHDYADAETIDRGEAQALVDAIDETRLSRRARVRPQSPRDCVEER